jgi:hypothetical protein
MAFFRFRLHHEIANLTSDKSAPLGVSCDRALKIRCDPNIPGYMKDKLLSKQTDSLLVSSISPDDQVKWLKILEDAEATGKNGEATGGAEEMVELHGEQKDEQADGGDDDSHGQDRVLADKLAYQAHQIGLF